MSTPLPRTSSAPAVLVGTEKRRPARTPVAGGTGRVARSRARAARPAATTAVTARSTCGRSTTPNTAETPSPARGAGSAVAGTRRSRAGSARVERGTSAASRARASGRSGSGSSSGSASGASGSSRSSSRRVSASGWWSSTVSDTGPSGVPSRTTSETCSSVCAASRAACPAPASATTTRSSPRSAKGCRTTARRAAWPAVPSSSPDARRQAVRLPRATYQSPVAAAGGVSHGRGEPGGGEVDQPVGRGVRPGRGCRVGDGDVDRRGDGAAQLVLEVEPGQELIEAESTSAYGHAGHVPGGGHDAPVAADPPGGQCREPLGDRPVLDEVAHGGVDPGLRLQRGGEPGGREPGLPRQPRAEVVGHRGEERLEPLRREPDGELGDGQSRLEVEDVGVVRVPGAAQQSRRRSGRGEDVGEQGEGAGAEPGEQQLRDPRRQRGRSVRDDVGEPQRRLRPGDAGAGPAQQGGEVAEEGGQQRRDAGDQLLDRVPGLGGQRDRAVGSDDG